MAVVTGTNRGFVTVAPSADPESGITNNIDEDAFSVKDTSPATATKITEIGWYCGDFGGGSSVNFEVAVYAHDSGDDKPAAVVGSISATNATGTSAGWKTATVDITISPNTIYWIAAQMDNTNPSSSVDLGNGVRGSSFGASALPDPWDAGSSEDADKGYAIYALWEAAASGTNAQINIGDDWKVVEGMQINIGDDWKAVAGAQINIGDAWKEIF